jgi:cyclopropane fatty-acyl-phospholipid synthase-like methyltransferase
MKRARTDAEISLAAKEFVWESAGLTEAHRWILPAVSRWLDDEKAGKILDLGCGNGGFTKALAAPGRELLGLDASESGIRLARESGAPAEFLQATMDSPLPRDLHGCFDAVISIEVIEHLLLPRDLFRRAREALQPGGHLLVTTPYHGYWKNLALALCNQFDQHWHPLRDYGHVKFFSIPTLRQLFQEEGFAVQKCWRVGRVPMLARSLVMSGTVVKRG